MSPSSAAKQRRPGRFAEGAALSGARISGRRLRIDVALENLAIEYRRCKAEP